LDESAPEGNSPESFEVCLLSMTQCKYRR
jgi:hypothetical protein